MSRAQQLMQQWLTHRLVLEHLLELIPDEFIHYKPWHSAMALGELAQHVAASTDMFVTIAKSGEGQIHMPTITPCGTMDQVLDVLRQLTEKTKATYTSLTDTKNGWASCTVKFWAGSLLRAKYAGVQTGVRKTLAIKKKQPHQ